jgi:hypothetical protein
MQKMGVGAKIIIKESSYKINRKWLVFELLKVFSVKIFSPVGK